MKVTILSGGVGGARMARGFDRLPETETTVVVNVGDDDTTYGLAVSPDLDTVLYTLAGIEGPQGWGRADDSFVATDQLADFGIDARFRLGDRDLGLKMFRTMELGRGLPLSAVTDRSRRALGVRSTILPVTDDRLRTEIGLPDGTWISFREYFVNRGHRDTVRRLRFTGHEDATPGPGVIDAIRLADLVLIGPSNPPLSIWPILSVPGIRAAIGSDGRAVAVSPLIAGKAVKGPADRVLKSLGFPEGNAGVVASYQGLVGRLVIDEADADDAASLSEIEVQIADTSIADPEAAARLAREILAR